MRIRARSLTLSALMTALTALLSPVAVPLGPGAVTLQTFLIALTGYMLPPKEAFFSALAYLLLGACGLPVFSMLRGGLSVLTGPTGGYIIAFPVMALMCALGRRRPRMRAAAGLAGLLVVYITGTAQLAGVAGLGIGQAILAGAAPYLVKDILSILCADYLARMTEKRLHPPG